MNAKTFPRLCLCALALATAASCGDDDDSQTPARGKPPGDSGAEARDAATPGAQQVLVGALAASDVQLAAVVANGRARLFFCGGPRSYQTATHWLQAELDADGRFEVANDAVHLQGQLDAGGLQGELTREGEAPAEFSAQPVRSSTLAGLYEAQSDCGRIGLIVTQRSATAAPTAQGACVGPGHAPEQVNPILPLATNDDGTIAVEVVRDGDVERARVHRAAAAP